MADRTIVIDADAQGVEKGMDTIRQGGVRMYEEMKGKAQQYSEKIQDQSRRVEELIQSERKRLKNVIDGSRLEIDMHAKLKLSQLDPNILDYEKKKKKILEEQREKLQEINQEYREQRQVINEAESKSGEDYGGASSSASDPSGGGSGGYGGFGGGVMAGAVGGSLVAMVGAIPVIGGMLGSMISIGGNLEKGQNSLRAMTGKEANFGGGQYFGMSTAELAMQQRSIARIRGVGGKSLSGDALDQLATEKGFGLEEGQLTGLAKFKRMGGDNPMELSQSIMEKAANSKLWDIELDGRGQIKGFAGLSEKMEFMGTLMEREAEISEQFSGERSASLLASFGKMGGGFEDGRGLERIMALDDAIKSGGGNEFMQSEIMGAISANNPEMGLVGIRQRMAQGVFGEGNLASVLERAQQVGGVGGETTQAFLMQLAPQLTGNPEALKALSMADPNMFRGQSGEDMTKSLSKFGLSKNQIKGRAAGATGAIEAVDASLQDVIGKVGMALSESIEEPLKKMAGEMVKAAGDPMGYVKQDMKEMIFGVGSDFKGVSKEIGESFKEDFTGTMKDIFNMIIMNNPEGAASMGTRIAKNKIKANGGTDSTQ